MRYLFTILAVFSILTLHAQRKGLYDISLKGLDGNKIQMKDYKGKAVFIVTCNAQEAGIDQLQFLESIYLQHKDKLVVIAVPVADFDADVNEKKVKKFFLDKLKLKYPVSDIVYARKNKGLQQNDLMRWLTHKQDNEHFDTDSKEAGEVFVIDEKGKMYARLAKGTNLKGSFFNLVIQQATKR